VIGWEDYYSRDIFHVAGFPYRDQIEELFIVLVYCMYILFVLKVPLNPNQSCNDRVIIGIRN